MNAKTPHPLNVPGDFYVENGCCICCSMPFAVAPGHFSYDDDHHCYVSRQPETLGEVDKMVEAVGISEVSCIRYRGYDAKVLRRLAAAGESEQCDVYPEAPSRLATVADDTQHAADSDATESVIQRQRVWWLRWMK